MRKTVNHSIICAGFGGQGIMTLGKVFAEAGMILGKNVTWIPSYGAEVRGGTAHSSIKISDEDIAGPIITGTDTAVIMNGPSLDKFETRIVPGGLLILNTSMSDNVPSRKDIDIVAVPLTDEAIKIGNIKVANIIAAGIFAAKKEILNKNVLIKAIEHMAAEKKDLIPVNIKALERGMELVNSL